MRYIAGVFLALMAGGRVFAQEAGGRCAKPDSIVVTGNSRVDEPTIRASMGILAGAPLNARQLQEGVKALFGTGQFDDVQVSCTIAANNKAVLNVIVKERQVLGNFSVVGPERVSAKSVRDKIDLSPGKPIDPGAVAKGITRIDSLYESSGYYLAKVTVDTTPGKNNSIDLAFHVDEGHRLAISGVAVHGDAKLSPKEVVGAMKTKPEGFFFWRKGEFDEDAFAADLAERIPDHYASQGFIDFQIVRDTLLVDRSRGKALIDMTVNEGKQYRVGSFDVIGNRRFSTDEIYRFYPFRRTGPSFTQSLAHVFLGQKNIPSDVFNRARWDDATQKLRTAYSNEGYIYASIRPVADRSVDKDSQPIVNLQWNIEEKSPAIVNRIEIVGNDYTTEGCIREAITLIPGGIFSQDALIHSYQNLGNLGFFDTPIPPPDTRPSGDQGDVDLIFHVKEKRTGNVNFGASTGQGTGVGGFIGLDQPNLFGECKKGSIQWQFGKYINNLTATYTDPELFGPRISGQFTAYHSQSRYTIGALGESITTGGNIQLGFPVPGTYSVRLFASYGLESIRYTGDTTSLLGAIANQCQGCIRSVVSLTLSHDTRFGMPYPFSGGMQTVTLDLDGGPLGGTAHYQRVVAELRGYSTLAAFGADELGSSPVKLVLGEKIRLGNVFGSTGPFFYSQAFALGGVQYGEQLRGYPEFSITPQGYLTGTSTFNATPASFGNTVLTTTTEMGLRLNSSIYLDLFLDAGNLWAGPRQFDPTRLYKGAGLGISIVTPLAPLGIDEAYGFDKLDALGRPNPGWQTHFRLGNIF